VDQNHSEGRTSDEAMLVQRAIGHDAEAFGKLYDMHVDRVYRHIYYRVGNEQDAEDLTQPLDIKPSASFKIKAGVWLMEQIHGRQTVTKWSWSRHNSQTKQILYIKDV